MSFTKLVRAMWPKNEGPFDQRKVNEATLESLRSLEARLAQLEDRHNSLSLNLASKVELLAGQLNDLLHSKGNH